MHKLPGPLCATVLLTLLSISPAAAARSEQTIIGYSQGGSPLIIYHVGGGPRSVLVLGGQHGGPEANTTRLAYQLLAYFQQWPEDIPDELRLDILPEANPDGLRTGSRQFLSGVDPNRNWGGPDWAPNASDSNGVFRLGLGGPEPFSEPETQALRDYILQTRPALVVNYHSRGGFLFGGRTGTGAVLSETYASASGYWRPGGAPAAGGGAAGSVLGYRATGNLNGWLSQQGIPGLLIELATSSDPEFARNLAGLRAVLPLVAATAEIASAAPADTSAAGPAWAAGSGPAEDSGPPDPAPRPAASESDPAQAPPDSGGAEVAAGAGPVTAVGMAMAPVVVIGGVLLALGRRSLARARQPR